jgi:CubicO group peptidase (beta-lactamase class C family)
MRRLLVALFAFTPAASRLPAQSCADSTAAFRRIVSEFQSRQRNVGLAVGVMLNGQVMFLEASGWADRERNLAATTDARFGLASITKAFTGITLLKLHELGRIDLDAEIQRYVPEFPRHPSAPVTVRALMAHLGGIRHWGPERNDTLYARHFDDVLEILPLFRDSAFVAVPGSRYSYSSYGYNLLAMAMQRASGTPFPELVRKTVLEPLGLRSVAFDRPGLDGPARPARYSWYDLKDFHQLDSAPVRVPDWDYSHNMAGGNMVGTVGDLLRFGRAVRQPGFLSGSSLGLLWQRPLIGGVESGMSFGWFVRTVPPRLGISGSNAGLQSGLSVWRDQDLVVAAVANSWGVGSRSGELMGDDENGLLGRLARVCGVD